MNELFVQTDKLLRDRDWRMFTYLAPIEKFISETATLGFIYTNFEQTMSTRHDNNSSG